MKILHTGDLHLGKTLHETSLLEDQKIMLDLLLEELSRDSYAALIIAGDVYDRTIPPAEAVELFSSFLVRLRSDFPDVTVFIIPGNHDSARRLAFADKILGRQNIHIAADPEESFTPIILGKDGNRLAFFLLPFLLPGTLAPAPETPAAGMDRELDLFDGDPAGTEPLLSSQSDLAREASRRFDEVLSKPEYRGIPAVLVAHLFMTGGEESPSERVFVGSAEKVPSSLFSGFSYVALGHLHKTQRVHDRIWYSGAPLAYAFDEAGTEKCFLRVELDTSSGGVPVTVTRIPVRPARPVVRLSGAFDDFYHGSAFDGHADSYLEITLTDSSLVANPMNLLRDKFPLLLSIRQGLAQNEKKDADNPAREQKKGRNPLEDFCSFQEQLYGTVDTEKKTLFSQLLESMRHES